MPSRSHKCCLSQGYDATGGHVFFGNHKLVDHPAIKLLARTIAFNQKIDAMRLIIFNLNRFPGAGSQCIPHF